MKRYAVWCFSAVLILFVGACEKMAVDKKAKAVQDEAVAEEPSVSTAMTPGTVATIVVGETPFSVEIAKTDAERAKGLMGRESLAANSGMWFVFPAMGEEKFWMKDTLIPLDLIYVDDNMKVVHVIENAPPESTELLISSAPFQYVLEVNAGTVDEHDIKVGDAVQRRIGAQ